MSLKALTRKLVAKGLNSLGDLQETATYRTVKTTFNATTGTNVRATTNVQIKATFTGMKESQQTIIDVQDGDQTALIAADPYRIAPKPMDEIVRGDFTYTVLAVKTDPAGALWMLHVRRS